MAKTIKYGNLTISEGHFHSGQKKEFIQLLLSSNWRGNHSDAWKAYPKGSKPTKDKK